MMVNNVGIPPESLGNNLDDEILKKISSLILNTQTKHGLIFSIDKFKIKEEGEIKFDNTGFTRYNVLVKLKMYVPILGEIISSKVKDLHSNGFYLDEPVEVFVNTNSLCQKNIGDKVEVKITKVIFNKGKFMVLAKETN